MILWIVLTVLCCAAVALVTIPLVRRYEARAGEERPEFSTYRNQLREVEQDRQAGQIGAEEADFAKIEIQRRMLAAMKSSEADRPVSPSWRAVALAATAAFVVLGAANIYGVLGRPDLPSNSGSSNSTAETVTKPEPSNMPAAENIANAGNVEDVIGKLAARLRQDPENADGWRMLGWSYFNTRRFAESAEAYRKALELEPENKDYKSSYAEAAVQAAGGIVTPAAQALFEKVLASDPKDERSRFYMALAREQAGDLSSALDMWIALFNDAPKEAGWLDDVKQRISELGAKTGRDVSAFMGSGLSAAAGSGDHIANPDQQAQIDAMIAKLAAKLEKNPADRDGWAMMIRSLKVNGDKAGAQRALAKAMEVFRNDPSTREQIAALADSLGVTGSDSSATVVSEDAIATASDMPSDEQQAMIRGMVDGLAEKLKASPHDAEGWKRLIRSRMVLNQADLARDALREALAEFSGDAGTSSEIAALARELGVTVD